MLHIKGTVTCCQCGKTYDTDQIKTKHEQECQKGNVVHVIKGLCGDGHILYKTVIPTK